MKDRGFSKVNKQTERGLGAGENSASPLIVFESVSLGYAGRAVVNGISFNVEDGDYLCIVGENGAGKSTLLQGMARLLKPLGGKIVFSPELPARSVGYLSQASAARNDFPASAREIVLSGMTGKMGFRPFYSRAEKDAAEKTMLHLEMSALQNRCFRELSGGQQRRVLIARSLCAIRADARNGAQKTPALLALDEPAAGLDPAAVDELYALLETLHCQTGITIVMVTHDTRGAQLGARRGALKYATRVLELKNGTMNQNTEAFCGR
jgi:zinc transport system ATP-binding protein